jgi:RNA ligase
MERMMYLPYTVLQPYLDDGLISEQIHPDAAHIRIYNYTPRCQYEGAWGDVTLRCRGIILDTLHECVIANCMPKFFNYEEHLAKQLPFPNETPIITEKVDGSMGQLYWLHGEPWIATRGSFMSEQAQWATAWFRRNFQYGFFREADGITHIFEIVYKANRIVVDYNFEGLVYLASRDTATGREVLDYPLPPEVRRAARIDAADYSTLRTLEAPNAEGFVALYPESGVRVKYKFAEYKRLHKLLTGLSEKEVWELLSTGADLDAYMQNVPDEFFQWFEVTKNNLLTAFQYIWSIVDKEWLGILAYMRNNGYTQERNRKEIALEILKQTYPKMLFAQLDGRRFDDNIWKLIKPQGAKVFRCGEE